MPDEVPHEIPIFVSKVEEEPLLKHNTDTHQPSAVVLAHKKPTRFTTETDDPNPAQLDAMLSELVFVSAVLLSLRTLLFT